MECRHELRFNGGDSFCRLCKVYLWDMPDEEVRATLAPENAEYLIGNRNKSKNWRPSKFNVTVDGNGDITSIKEAY